MVTSKEIHLSVNTNSVPFMYHAYSVTKQDGEEFNTHLFTTDNCIQMYSFLYQHGYSNKDVILD